MIKVVVIGYGDQQTASTRFRFIDRAAALAEQGVELNVYYRQDIGSRALDDALRTSSLIVNQKLLISPREGRVLTNAGIPIIFDFDDAIWTRPGKHYGWLTGRRVSRRIRYWLSKASQVTVANNFLADYAAKITPRVSVIRMTNPLSPASRPESKPSPTSKPVTIGWMGAPGNLHCLEKLGPMLREIKASNPALQFRVFCGKRPNLPIEHDWVAYDPDKEQDFAHSLDIGLLPVPDDEYSKGKSPIKALFYMSAGAVVVGNVRGASAEIITAERAVPVENENDWAAALLALVDDAGSRERLSQAGATFVNEYHNAERIVQDMASLYKQLAATADAQGGNTRSLDR